jgi:pyruvate ferredoxin oxidoreductase alpha subunit
MAGRTDKKSKIALTGGAAATEALRQINPDVMPVYPITPQTPIIASFAKMQAKKLVDTEIITVESEHSVMSACIGSEAAGARTVTATSSQGLALMNEMLYIASGNQLPILMLISARALSAPLNIHGDHSDVMGSRDAGWMQIFCENVQEVYDNTIIGLKTAENSKVPVMVIMDGFITSHSVENLEVLPDETVKKYVEEYNPKNRLLDVENPVTFGILALQNSYFEFKIKQEKRMQGAFEHYKNAADEYAKISQRQHDAIEKYFVDDAEYILIIAGSAAGTAKEAVDKMRKDGKKVGLLKIKLFRPFPYREIKEALENVKAVATCDRAMSFGAYPPIYSDIVNSLCQISNTDRQIQPYVYGLGGRDIFQSDVKKVFDDLINENISSEIKFIGTNNI